MGRTLVIPRFILRSFTIKTPNYFFGNCVGRGMQTTPPPATLQRGSRNFSTCSTSQSGPPRPEEFSTPRYAARAPSERGACLGVDLSVTSRNLEMHRHASREAEALRKAGGTGTQHLAAISRGESSSEGFRSSDDEDGNVSRTASNVTGCACWSQES